MSTGRSGAMAKLPDFVIIGAQKAGTTSLHAYLQQIPELFLPERKEPHFFCSPGDGKWPAWTDDHLKERYREFLLDVEDYVSLFNGAGDRLCGESSTMYLNDPDVPERIARLKPEMKVIALLRDPATRAFSSWKMWRRAGLEPLDFQQALDVEDERQAANFGPATAYVDTGRYATHLDRWEQWFDADQLLLLDTQRFAHDPYGVIAEVVAFLDVQTTSINSIDTSQHNVGDQTPRSYRANTFVRHSALAELGRSALPDPLRRRVGTIIKRANTTPAPSLDPAIAAQIRHKLEADTERLERRTGWDLSAWKQEHPAR